MTRPLRVLRQIVAPNGRHRAGAPLLVHEPGLPVRSRGVLDEVRLEGILLRPVLPATPFGAAVPQAWRDCPGCGRATAGVVNKDGWMCGLCLTVSGGAS